MTEHTPGPWFCATGCSWRRFLTVNGEEDVCVPTASRHDGHPDLIVSEADARLIAAAPDLLEACRLLETAEHDRDKCPQCMDRMEMAPETCELCFPAFDDARITRRNAIAKAYGPDAQPK